MIGLRRNFVFTIFCLTIYLCSVLVYAKLPSDIVQCKASDSSCVMNNINVVFKNKDNGDSDFGLESIDPVEIGDIGIDADPGNPVNINIQFKNSRIVGAKNMQADKIKGFGQNPTGRHYILLKAPSLSLLGDYTVMGKIMILPITGAGRGNITMANATLKLTIEGTSTTKDGQLYMDANLKALDFNGDRFHMRLDNLFNGDKQLSDGMNKFSNENWKEIFGELKTPIENALKVPINNIIKNVFTTTPYTDLFKI